MIQILQPSRTRAALLAAALAALALIALLAAAALWSGVASAQTPDDDEPSGGAAGEQAPEDEAITTLQRTQIAAEIPEQHNELFQLQWGGGSLYQLKQRLATMSCMADLVWVYENDQWHGYSQYQVPSTLNAQFTGAYSEFIPAGTLYASCFRICEFQYFNITPKRECRTFEYLRQKNFFNVPPYPIDDTTLCANDFDPLVVERVFPLLSLHPETCIVRQTYQKARGYFSNFFIRYNRALTYPNSVPFIVVYSPDDYTSPNNPSDLQQRNETRLLYTEIHELCHINQYWHVVQALQPDNPLTARPNDLWHETPAGKELIALAEFTNNNGEWTLPQNSVYNDIYSTIPIELGAELCVLYIKDRIGVENMYKYWYTERGRGYILRNEPIEFDASTYLTPEVREWIETYIVLPN